MANVALVEKVPSKTDFIRHFDNDFQFDRFSLCSDKTKKKILKRDVDIDIDIDDYEFIILVHWIKDIICFYNPCLMASG